MHYNQIDAREMRVFARGLDRPTNISEYMFIEKVCVHIAYTMTTNITHDCKRKLYFRQNIYVLIHTVELHVKS